MRCHSSFIKRNRFNEIFQIDAAPHFLKKVFSSHLILVLLSSGTTLWPITKRCSKKHKNRPFLMSVSAFFTRHTNDIKTPTVCIATASPAKFPEAVKASGIEMPLTPSLAQLFSSPTRCKEMKKGEDWFLILRSMIDEISRKHLGNQLDPFHPNGFLLKAADAR